MKNMPLVSIITPTYNRKHTISRAIESVKRQTYTNWEMIIVDDGSKDETEQIVRQYAEKDNRIKFLSNGVNKGPSVARNTGIKNSQGEIIAFLDSDDEWMEHHLYDSVQALQEEKVNVCFALWYEKNKQGEVSSMHESPSNKERMECALEHLHPQIDGNRYVFSSPEFFEYNTAVKTVNCYHINSMVCKREVLDKVGMFNEKLWASEDMDLIYRILHEYDFCLLRDYHFTYNIGDEGNLYAFMDRSKINLECLLVDATLVKKLTFFGKNDCRMMKLRKELASNSKRVKDRAACIDRCNRRLDNAYFTIGYINKKLNKSTAVYYLLKSLRYRYSKIKVQLIVNILLPFVFPNVYVDKNELRIV